MRGKFTFVCLVFFFGFHSAFSQEILKEKKIFLWDVTLSMQGRANFKGKPTANIWEEVKTELLKAIRRINDEETFVSIVPFQGKVIDVWTEKADAIGKERLMEKIRNFETSEITCTNIETVLSKSIELIDSDRRNFVFLFTDGAHNDPKSPISKFTDIVNRWNVKSLNSFMFYVMLTDAAASFDAEEILKGGKNIFFVKSVEGIGACILRPEKTEISLNVKDKEYTHIEIPFGISNKSQLKSNFQVQLNLAENSFFDLTDNNGVLSKDNKLHFALSPKSVEDILLKNHPDFYDFELTLNWDHEKYPLTFIVPNKVVLHMVNKKEKIFKIYVEN